MKIDLGSFSFGSTLLRGTGTPSWGTAFGQNKPDYFFHREGFEEIVVGMLYNAVPLNTIMLPIGKGGAVVNGDEDSGIQLASIFYTVYVNDKQIPYPFAMIIYKEQSASHPGRRSLKYSNKIYFKDNDGRLCVNSEFFKKVATIFKLSQNACWFVYEIRIENQTELHLDAVFVNKHNNEVYADSKERKDAWQKLLLPDDSKQEILNDSRNGKKWNKKELTALRINYEFNASIADIAKKLHRHETAIQSKLQELGLIKWDKTKGQYVKVN